MKALSISLGLSVLLVSMAWSQKSPTYKPSIKPASNRAAEAMGSIQRDPGFDISLWAAEPDVANVVCFWIDRWGRIYTGESFRQEENGVPDNRNHGEWLQNDLRNQTVADRRAMYLSYHPELATRYTKEHDRIRLLTDTNGDGKADRVQVFADGFNDILDGTGAGILSRGRDVYYTCIPNVWKLSDHNGDGVADRRDILSHGYGVRIALRGHDSHGLIMGHDGRLYYSIGDRGFSIMTREGKHYHLPHTGAVFRCELDGSNLEIFATGLRNPQELAFDDYGNLFTVDNNSDSEDRARVVYVVEGGETGWRMNFQYRADRGGWVSEGWWKTRFPGQAAFHIPPLAHLGSGPSGFACYPGTGMPEKYQGVFFVCDFLGGRTHSGVRAFRLQQDGAGFKMGENWHFVKNILPTDLGFMPDGSMMVSDWVRGWVGEGVGSLYQVRTDDADARAAGAAAQEILTKTRWEFTTEQELLRYLEHQDRRVRLEAQYALADRFPEALGRVALSGRNSMARLHGVWGTSQAARQLKRPELLKVLVPLLADKSAEIRARTASVLGEGHVLEARAQIIELLKDQNSRVCYFAAMALHHLGGVDALRPVLAMVGENADKDLYLRHAGVMALVGVDDAQKIHQEAHLRGRSERLAILLALRRLKSPLAAAFLNDEDPFNAEEAARALYDVPIEGGYTALADVLAARTGNLPLLRRALASVELLGDPKHLPSVVDLALDSAQPQKLREEAMLVLWEWTKERPTDRILNMWRPRSAGDASELESAIRPHLAKLLGQKDDRVRRFAARLAGRHHVPLDDELLALVRDGNASDATRIAGLRALAKGGSESLPDGLDSAYASGRGKLRGVASELLALSDPVRAVQIINKALAGENLRERQLAFPTLARIQHQSADRILVDWMRRLNNQQVDRAIALDLLEASRARSSNPQHEGLQALVKSYEKYLTTGDPLRKYELALEGGDANRGRKIFREKSETSCRRCHALGNDRPTDKAALAGPDLTKIGAIRDRAYLLRSIATPSKDIAEGFAEVMIQTKEDDVYRGRIVEDRKLEVVMDAVEAGFIERVTIKKDQIAYQQQENSSMPEDLVTKLSTRELRDLIEFLSNCK